MYPRKAKDNSNQKWKYNEANQEIDSFIANLVVDAKGEGIEPGTPVIAYGAKAPVAANQQWYTFYSLCLFYFLQLLFKVIEAFWSLWWSTYL